MLLARVSRRSRPETALVDLERANLRFERRARDAQPLCCTGWPEYPSAARAQSVFDDRSLLDRQRVEERQPAFGRGPRCEPPLADGKFVALAYDHWALDDILHLANGPRPRRRPQPGERPSARPSEGLC